MGSAFGERDFDRRSITKATFSHVFVES